MAVVRNKANMRTPSVGVVWKKNKRRGGPGALGNKIESDTGIGNPKIASEKKIEPLLTIGSQREALMRRRRFLVGLLAFASLTVMASSAKPAGTSLRFEVRIAPGLWDKKGPGRVLVVLGKDGEPRNSLGRTGMSAPPVL